MGCWDEREGAARGVHRRRSGHRDHPAHAGTYSTAAVYSGTMQAMALACLAMWWYAAHRAHLLHAHIDQVKVRAATRRFGAGPLIYLTTVGLSFVNATATLVTHLVIALYYCFDQLAVRDREAARPRRAG